MTKWENFYLYFYGLNGQTWASNSHLGTSGIKNWGAISSKLCTFPHRGNFLLSAVATVWPDVGIKSSPSLTKVAQKVATTVWLKKVRFSKLPKKLPNIWATFAKNFIDKKFQIKDRLYAFMKHTISVTSKKWPNFYKSGPKMISQEK